MARNPYENIHALANALVKFPLRKPIGIRQIEEKSGLDRDTVWRYSQIISYVQKYAPEIETEMRGIHQFVEVMNLPALLQYPPRIRILVKMYLRGAISPETSVPHAEVVVLDDEPEAFDELVKAEHVKSTNYNEYYVTPSGVMIVFKDVRDFIDQFDKPVSHLRPETPSPLRVFLSVADGRAWSNPYGRVAAQSPQGRS